MQVSPVRPMMDLKPGPKDVDLCSKAKGSPRLNNGEDPMVIEQYNTLLLLIG